VFNLDMGSIMGHVMRALEPQFAVIKHICGRVNTIARIFAQEYGVPPENGDESRLQPRSMTKLPVIVEKTIAAGETEEFDLEKLNQNRVPSRGFYRNIGNDPFKATITGVDGQASAAHTLLSKDVIAITNYVSKITVTAGTTPVTVQILAQ
jgi:hypothetical protein